MMKTKTIKTPLMMAEAFGLTCCPSALVPESKLSHRSEAHHGFILKLSHHEWKKPRKSGLVMRSWFSLFLPLVMSLVAKQRVMMAGLGRELAHRHKAMTSTRKLVELKTSTEEFLRFLFSTVIAKRFYKAKRLKET